jgi:hypothetical protein
VEKNFLNVVYLRKYSAKKKTHIYIKELIPEKNLSNGFFTQKTNLSDHQRTHTEKNPFE